MHIPKSFFLFKTLPDNYDFILLFPTIYYSFVFEYCRVLVGNKLCIIKKAAKLKPICVKTPGAPISGSSGDESSSDEEESEAEKLAKKKKAETKKLFRSDSSLSVKEMAGAYSDLGKKHKLSPPQPEERRKRNKGESTN